MPLTNRDLTIQPQQIPGFNLPSNMSSFNTGGQDFLNRPGTAVNTGFNAGIDPSAQISPIPDFISGGLPGTPEATPGFFDEAGGSRFLVPGLEALTGLGGLYLGKQQLDLGKEQFDFSKQANVRDFNSQAQVFNTNLEGNQRSVLSASGGYDTSTPEGQAQFDQALNDYVERNKISATPA